MTDQPQPSRVMPGEISDLLDQARSLDSRAPLAEHIAYHERKARLLSRAAADLDTPEAHAVAADAWSYLSGLCRRADAGSQTEARQ
jgi:hypothetical protein